MSSTDFYLLEHLNTNSEQKTGSRATQIECYFLLTLHIWKILYTNLRIFVCTNLERVA